jgi:hypothetical protein
MSIEREGWGDIRPDGTLGSGGFDAEQQAAPEGRESGEGAWSEKLDTYAYGEGELLLPGKGDSHPECGSVRAKGFCDGAARDDGGETHVVYGKHLCGRRECPRCWSSEWAGPRTVSVVQRLGAARYAAEEPQNKRAVHAVFSPPEGDVESVTALFEVRKQVSDLADEHGVRGGIIVPHAYRATEDAKMAFREQGEYGTLWRFIRQNGTSWRDQVYWSPHYHVVGLCRDFEESDPDADGGWIAKNIKHKGSHSLAPFRLQDREGYDDMAGVVRYLLSHATFPAEGSRQVVTWYGSVHGVNFGPSRELSEGAWSVIQRTAEEVVGAEGDESGESGPDDDENEECPVEGCPGDIHPAHEIPDYLRDNRDNLAFEQRCKLEAVYGWSVGDLDPPPGLRLPRTEGEAAEVVAVLSRKYREEYQKPHNTEFN